MILTDELHHKLTLSWIREITAYSLVFENDPSCKIDDKQHGDKDNWDTYKRRKQKNTGKLSIRPTLNSHVMFFKQNPMRRID